MKKIFNKKGFSFPELMTVVAITLIIAALGSVAVINYERRLRILEADETAKEIFLAAQNHLTGSWANGEWSTAREVNQSNYFGNTGEITDSLSFDDRNGHEYYNISNSYRVSPNILTELILPYGSIEEQIRTDDSYIIQYDAKTTTIYDVYYVHGVQLTADDAKYIVEHEDNINDRIQYAVQNRARNNGEMYYIGHYGEGKTPLGPTDDYIAPTVTVRNEENLWLEIEDTNLLKYPDSVLTLTYTGKISHARVSVRIPILDLGYNNELDGVYDDSHCYEQVPEEERYVNDSSITKVYRESSELVRTTIDMENHTRKYYVLLDSLTLDRDITLNSERTIKDANENNIKVGVYGQFVKHFKNFTDQEYGIEAGSTKFISGEDVTVVATLYSPHTGKSVKGKGIFNSLFLSITPDTESEGRGNYLALILNGRHLQNLSREASGIDYIPSADYSGNDFNFLGGMLVNDIYWDDFGEYEGYYSALQDCPTNIPFEADFSAWKMPYINRYNAAPAKEFLNNGFGGEGSGFYFLPISNNRHNAGGGIGYGNKYPCFTSDYTFTFDGNGYRIYNLDIYHFNSDGGIFAQVVNANLTIKNIILIDPRTEYDPYNTNNLSLFCGKIQEEDGKSSYLAYINCHAYASSPEKFDAGSFNIDTKDINDDENRVGVYNSSLGTGGIIGHMMSGTVLIENCSVSVPVVLKGVANGGYAAGGLVGYAQAGDLTVKDSYYGGYAGLDLGEGYHDFSLENINIVSYLTDLATKQDIGAGGLVGRVDNTAYLTMDNCFSSASVYGNRSAGGLIGFATESGKSKITITNCYSASRVFYQPNEYANPNVFRVGIGGNIQSLVNGSSNNYYIDYTKAATDYEDKVTSISVDDIMQVVSYDNFKTNSTSTRTYSYSDLGIYPFRTITGNETDIDGDMYDFVGDWAHPKEIEVRYATVSNGNILTASFEMDPLEKYATFAVVGNTSLRRRYVCIKVGDDMKVYGAISNSVIIDKTNSAFTTLLPGAEVHKNDEGYYVFTITLDNPVIREMNFNYLFGRNSGLYPGENISVYATRGLNRPAEEIGGTTNSLFAYDENSAISTAHITSARHLINLEKRYSGLNNIAITNVSIDANIQWEESATKLTNQPFNAYLTDVRGWLVEYGQTKIDRSYYESNAWSSDDSVHDGLKMHAIINDNIQTIEGNNHTLENINLYYPTGKMYSSLFNLASIRSIKNLTFSHCTSNSTGETSIVLWSSSAKRDYGLEFDNISFINGTSVSSDNSSAALLIPVIWNVQYLNFHNITIDGTTSVTGVWNVAGLAASVQNSRIDILNIDIDADSYIISNRVEGDTEHAYPAGGLIGVCNTASNYSNIDINANTFKVESNRWYAGGIIGHQNGGGLNLTNTAIESKNMSVYSGNSHAGGIAGYVGNSAAVNFNLTNSHIDADVLTITSLGTNAGGLMGRNDSTLNMQNNYVHSDYGTITGKTGTGGAIGYTGYPNSISGIKVFGKTFNILSTTDSAGGLIGEFNSGGSQFYLGNSAFSGSSVRSTATANNIGVGGIVGKLSRSDNNSNNVIDNCYASGRTVGGNYRTAAYDLDATGTNTSVGGIIGLSNIRVSINNCYSTLSARGGYVGGIAGRENTTRQFGIYNCYSESKLTPSTTRHSGEILGYAHHNALSYGGNNYLRNLNADAKAVGNNNVQMGEPQNAGNWPFMKGSDDLALSYDSTIGTSYPFKTVNTTTYKGHTYGHLGDWYDPTNAIIPGLYRNGELVKDWNQLVNDYPMYFSNSEIMTYVIGNYVYAPSNLFEASYADQLICPDSLTSIDPYSFYQSPWLKKIDISMTNVSSINEYTFQSSTLEEILFPEDSVTRIKDYAFNNCYNLQTIELPESLESIGHVVFMSSGLIELSIPENVTSIGQSVIRGCSNLDTLTIGGNLITIPEEFNAGDSGPKHIIIREGTEEIGDNAFTSNYDVLSIELPSTMKIIGDSSLMYTSITQINLPDGLEEIGSNAFMQTDLTSITIPETVRTIGEGTLLYGTPVEEITFGSSLFEGEELPGVTYLPDDYFSYGLSNLKIINLRSGITSIGKGVFNTCSNVEEVNLPDTLIYIGEYTFQNLKKISEVIIPDSVEIIKDRAFSMSSSTDGGYTYLYIGKNVKTIERQAFWNDNLQQVDMASEQLETIGSVAFAYGKFETFTIPDTVTYIDNSAFMGCSNLKSIVIPYNTVLAKTSATDSSLNNIFSGCTSLESITFENGAEAKFSNYFMSTNVKEVTILDNFENIPDNWATSATYLEKINLPDNVVSIGNNAFNNTKITEFIAPETLESIGNTPFNQCNYLEVIDLSASQITELNNLAPTSLPELNELILPANIERIGSGSFSGSYPKLLTITIPESMKFIDGGNFFNANNLEEAIFENKNWFRYSDYTVINDTLEDPTTAVIELTAPYPIERYDAEENSAGLYFEGELVTPWSILVHRFPNNFAVEGEISYVNNTFTSLDPTKYDEIKIDSSITTINSGVFSGCSWLKHIDLANVEEIKDGGVFSGCSNLEELILPDTLKVFGSSNLGGCSSLKVFKTGSGLESFGSSNFGGNTALEEVDFSASTIEELNSDFFSSGWYGNLTTLKLPSGVITIGDAAISATLPSVIDFELPETVESIGAGNFMYMQTQESFTIPDSVTYFGGGCFQYSTGIKELIVGEGIELVNAGTFSNLTNLERIEFRGALELGNAAITSMSDSITEVILNDGLEKIGESAFASRSNIEELIIPNSVTTIGSSAFASMTGLSYIELPEELELINSNVFAGCTSLTSIELPDTVKYVDSHAFDGSGLESIDLPNELVVIGLNAFATGNIESVTIPASVSYIYGTPFGDDYEGNLLTEVIFEDTVGWTDAEGNDLTDQISDPVLAAALLKTNTVLIKNDFDPETLAYLFEEDAEDPSLDGYTYANDYEYHNYTFDDEDTSDYGLYNNILSQPNLCNDSRRLSVEIYKEDQLISSSSITISKYTTIEELITELEVDRLEVYMGEDLITPEGIDVHSYTINGQEIMTDIKLNLVGYKD